MELSGGLLDVQSASAETFGGSSKDGGRRDKRWQEKWKKGRCQVRIFANNYRRKEAREGGKTPSEPRSRPQAILCLIYARQLGQGERGVLAALLLAVFSTFACTFAYLSVVGY